MKRLCVLMMAMFTLAFFLFAQDAANNNNANAGDNNFKTEALTNFLIDDFEFANTWNGSMPRDFGVITIMRRDGGPAEVVSENADSNKFILGAKVEYFKTGFPWFALTPPRPVKVPGVTREVSVWVAGRNNDNKLSFFIKDVYGTEHKIGNESLNFLGWKNVTVPVSASIPQEGYRGGADQGIYFKGIRIDVGTKDSYGKYFIYFDNLVANTDMYLETYKEQNDPLDTW